MVQNLMCLRFANSVFEPLMNRQHVSSVTISFKVSYWQLKFSSILPLIRKTSVPREEEDILMSSESLEILCRIILLRYLLVFPFFHLTRN